MQELIEEFVTDVFSPEFIINVRKAISLFEAFEHQNAYGAMIDSINNESVADLHARADSFIIALSNQLNFIIKEHLIILNNQASIADQIMIADALYRVQHLEDYTSISSILTLEDDAIDKMALILSELTTNYDQGYFLTIINKVDNRTLDLLDMFIQQKLSNIYETTNNSEIIKRIKLFNTVIGKDNVGYILLEAGMLPGLDIELYLPYIQEYLVNEHNVDMTAKNILSIIYMSNTDISNILNAYRTLSDEIINNPELGGKVEACLIMLMGKITEAIGIENEKNRLS